MRTGQRRWAAGWLLVAAAAACANGTRGEGAASASGTAGAVSPAAREPGDSLPPALLGQGAPPRGEAVQYVTGDAATTGYLVTPDGDGPHPAVILIHEWDGLSDRVRQVADALADEGYVALAADLYGGRTGSNREENVALVSAARAAPERLIANLNAAAAFLRARPDVTGRVATIGWCFGGGVALSYALGGEHHEGTAIFYGQLVTDPAALAALDHPIYGTFAAEDEGIPPAEVERFVAALRAAGVENDVHVYDAVDHGFWLYVERDLADARGPAADAWARLRAYLRRTLAE